ncbi:MAG TPA: hypothetical protein VKP65_18245, partial [Rhodothermales bacterium]|nr:hypothetical protein [Rhodothermales bacterium]
LQEKQAAGGGYILADGRGIQFRATWDALLKAVSVHTDANNTEITIQLLDENGVEVDSVTETIETSGVLTRVPLGFSVRAHETYSLVASAAAGVRLYRETNHDYTASGVTATNGIKHVMRLLTGVDSGTPTGSYYFFYRWEIGYAVPPVPQVWEPYETGLAERDPAGGFINVLDKGIAFTVTQDLRLDAVSVYGETTGDVVVRLLDNNSNVIEETTATLDEADTKTRIALAWEIETGDYHIDTLGSGVRLFRETPATFPEGLEDVLVFTGGVPSLAIYFFFYDWEVSLLEPRVQTALVTKEDVRLAVKDRLHHYRNLCEDFVNICDLLIEEIAVCADIELAPDADVEEVQAEIFYQVGLHVSPIVTFYTIEELLARGKTTDEIFEGPLLDHGFIDDDEFRAIERRCRLRTSDIIQIIMDVPGVVSVKNISLLSFIDGVFNKQADWILDLDSPDFRAPEFTPERSKLIFYKNDLPYYANLKEVLDLLDEKKSREVQSKLKGHEQDLPVPVGTYKNLSDYYPLQNELPETYRVGRQRVPASFPALRQAQARQLKAYLLFFEQLFANYLAQLANVEALFSWETDAVQSYFTQVVDNFADPKDIYIDYNALPQQLADIIEDTELAEERKVRFLEHLLGRYSEVREAYRLLMQNMLGDDALARVIGDMQLLLEDYPIVSSQRGKGFDYRFPDDPDNVTGYQRRVARLLGIRDVTRRELAGHRLSIVQVGDNWHFVLVDEGGVVIFTSIECETEESIEALLDFALGLGGDEDNYVVNGSDTAFDLVRRCPGAPDEVIGSTSDKAVWEDVVAYFKQVHEAEGMHVVEHMLLRKRTEDDPFMPVQINKPGDCICVELRDPYSFRVSVVLPSWPERFQDLRFRRMVVETLRLEAPAHVLVKVCWVSHKQMKAFEQCQTDWLEKLAALDTTLGGCRLDLVEAEEATPTIPLSGQLPLPPTTLPEHTASATTLQDFIDKLHDLDNVYPLARLHDCTETDGDKPQISLNNTSLGTF